MSKAPPTPIMMRAEGTASALRAIHRSCFGAPRPTNTIAGERDATARVSSRSRSLGPSRAVLRHRDAVADGLDPNAGNGPPPSFRRVLRRRIGTSDEGDRRSALGRHPQQQGGDLDAGPSSNATAAADRLDQGDAGAVGQREVGGVEHLGVPGILARVQQDLGVRREDPRRALAVEEALADLAQSLLRGDVVEANPEDPRRHRTSAEACRFRSGQARTRRCYRRRTARPAGPVVAKADGRLPEPMGSPGDSNDDDARTVLERELYWAGDASTATSQSTRELRIALHDFAATMRADERSRVPRQEPLLGSMSRWKRSLKVVMYEALRPVTHRYDRLLGDLASMNRVVVERLAEAEAEIESLRHDLEDLRRLQERD